MRLRRRKCCVAPVSKDGAASWFETPRTRLRNRSTPKIAAPHHEAERDRVCIKGVVYRGGSDPRYEEIAMMSSSDSLATTGFISSVAFPALEPWRIS